MGTPLPEPEPGPACSLCFGVAGSPLGPGPPPDLLTVQFSGIRKGSSWNTARGEPPEGYYTLPSFGACFWGRVTPSEMSVDITDNPFGAFARSTTGFTAFADQLQPACALHYINQLTSSSGVFYDGVMDILL